MSIKNAISNNGINSATFNGKNYTRREVNGVVFYDITSSSSGATSGGGASLSTGSTAPDNPGDGDLWFDESVSELYAYIESQSAWIQTNGGGGSGGGANVTTSDTLPASGSDGDLWYDETSGGLYVYTDSINGWIQTNGGGSSSGSGASVNVSDDAPSDASQGDLWYDSTTGSLYIWMAGSTNAWIQTNGGGSSSGGNGNFSTGWVNTDGTTDVENGATLNFDHNLGTADLIVQVYMAKDANGTDQTLVVNELVQSGGLNFEWGCQVQNVTSSQLTVQLLQEGTVVFNSVAHTAYNWGTTWTHIKVVASSGASSGPRAYVTFDGQIENVPFSNDISHGIVSSYNVASITDGGPGLYYVDFTSPILDPVATYSVGPCKANTFAESYPERHQIRYFESTSSTSGITSAPGGSIARIFIGVVSRSSVTNADNNDPKFISLVVH